MKQYDGFIAPGFNKRCFKELTGKLLLRDKPPALDSFEPYRFNISNFVKCTVCSWRFLSSIIHNITIELAKVNNIPPMLFFVIFSRNDSFVSHSTYVCFQSLILNLLLSLQHQFIKHSQKLKDSKHAHNNTINTSALILLSPKQRCCR